MRSPSWLRAVPERVGDRRLPAGRIVFTGCGTSFHAAQTGGEAMQSLEAVLSPPEADLLVVVSHEGGTALALEAVRAFSGPTWLITGKEESPLAEAADEVLVVTPEIEESYCHTASYTAAVAALAVLRGEDVSGLPGAVERILEEGPPPLFDGERVAVVGGGRDWPTAQEAVLKLREGVRLAAEAHHTEQILHGHLAAIDETVRVFVLEGEGRAAERAGDVVRALGEIGAETTLIATEHPAADIVRFQLLTLALAEQRGVDPDKIRWDEPRWDAARQSYSSRLPRQEPQAGDGVDAPSAPAWRPADGGLARRVEERDGLVVGDDEPDDGSDRRAPRPGRTRSSAGRGRDRARTSAPPKMSQPKPNGSDERDRQVLARAEREREVVRDAYTNAIGTRLARNSGTSERSPSSGPPAARSHGGDVGQRDERLRTRRVSATRLTSIASSSPVPTASG